MLLTLSANQEVTNFGLLDSARSATEPSKVASSGAAQKSSQIRLEAFDRAAGLNA